MSFGIVYAPKPCLVDGNSLTFASIQSKPEYDRISAQMLRISDMLQSKGQPSVNFEFVAL